MSSYGIQFQTLYIQIAATCYLSRIQVDGCIVWNATIQYSARRNPLFVHKLFTSCIWRCLVSCACDWLMSALSAALLTFNFQFSLHFVHVRQPGSTAAYVVYPTSDIDVAENLGRYLSCMERTAWGNDFQLILTVKMETRHPIEGSFGSEFPAICNHCIVMTAWSHYTLKYCKEFLHFFWKTTPYAEILF